MTAMEKNNKTLNVPNLRFPEFSGEWEKGTLQAVATLSKGTGISKDQLSEDGQSCILYGELYTKYRSEIIDTIISKTDIDPKRLVRSQTNDVIIPCSGESAVDIATARCVKQSDVLLGGDLNIIRLKGEHDGSFFAYQLNGKRKYDIAKVAQGVSVVHLYGEHLKGVKVNYPSSAEQKKISSLLALIDQRIETQKKIIEDLKKLKDAISKSLFLRTDLLEKRIHISEIGNLKNGYAFQSSSYDDNGEYEIVTISNVTGDRNICSDGCNRILTKPSDLQSHQELKYGDILISLTGNVGRVSLCSEGKFLLNQRVGLLKLNAGVNAEYIYQVISTKRFEQAMISCGQGAAQMNISKGDIENYNVPYSDNSSVLLHIASILKTSDACILVESRKLQLLKIQKRHLLTQMFI